MVFKKENQTTEKREKMRDGEGVVELTALAGELPSMLRLFSEIRLNPGCSIGYHVHEGETELFYFTAGSGRVRDDDTEARVRAGDVMSTPSGHGHSVTNDGSEPLVFVAAIVLNCP